MFQLGDWVQNTSNRSRNVGVIVKVIDDTYCDVFWTDSKYYGTIRRDGTVDYGQGLFIEGHEDDRIVNRNVSLVIHRH